MAHRKTLNETQMTVLRWIADGCPDGVMQDQVTHRISAAALRNRGLVRTAGRGPTWNASITPAGKEYLQCLEGPNPPRPRQPNVSVTQQLVDDVVAAVPTMSGRAAEISEFRNDGRGLSQWLRDNPAGFVLNGVTLKLHTTGCQSLEPSEYEPEQLTRSPKICSLDRTNLELWALREKRRPAIACQVCEP